MRVPLPAQMHVLYNRNFRLYWTGQLISLTGTWMQILAQSWVVLRLTDSVAALGVVNLAQSLPTLLLMLTGGVVADRWDRRRIMIVTQAALMVLAFVMAALIAADALTLTLLLIIAVLTGIATAYDMPAQQALVPDLVEPRVIPQAIAMNQVIFNGSRLLGPAIAGLALATLPLASVYVLNGLSFIAVIASLMVITTPKRAAGGPARGSMLDSLRVGLAYVWSQSKLRSLFAIVALTVLLVFPPLAVLFSGYVKEALDRGTGTVAVLMAVSGAASMLGAFGLLWIPPARRGFVMALGIVASAISLLALGLLQNVIAATIATGMLSLGFSMFMGLNATIVQQMAPPELRGRVMSVSGLMFSGVLPFGGLLMSLAVAQLGFAQVYLVSAAVYALVALALFLPSGVLGFVPPEQPAVAPGPRTREPAGVAAD
jgi:MFS family permease